MPAELIVDRAHLWWDDLVTIVDDDGVEALWDPPRIYEVRRGPYWPTAICVGHTHCPKMLTRNFTAAADTYMVRPLDVGGRYVAPPTELSVDFDTPENWSGYTERDEVSSVWSGTRLSCSVDSDGYLTFDRDATTATYTTPEIDMGDDATWELTHLVHVIPTDFSWLSGRPIHAFSGQTLGDLVGVPAGRTVGDLADYDLRGPVYEPDLVWGLEVTVYDTTGVPGTFRRFEPTGYPGRYAQFRLTMTRSSAAGDFEVTGATNASPIEITTGTDHGLQDGRRVRIWGVGGNTAANGTWTITVTGDDTFTLDDSSGSGSYTSGGTVVSGVWGAAQAMKTAYALGPSSSFSPTISSAATRHILSFDGAAGLWKNHLGPTFIGTSPEYAGGADPSGATDSRAAIQAALDAAGASGDGGTVILPEGNYTIDSVTATGYALRIPNKVRLLGAAGHGTRLNAGASYPNDTYMIRLGEGSGIVFNCRADWLVIDCMDKTGSGGVYSDEAQETSGCHHVVISKYTDEGITFVNCSQPTINEVFLAGSENGSTYGIYFEGVSGTSIIRDAWIVPSTSGTHGTAIFLNGGNTKVENFHCERHTNGIYFSALATGGAKGVYGHASSMTHLVRIASTVTTVTLEDLQNPNVSANTITIDGSPSVHYTQSSIEQYIHSQLVIGGVGGGVVVKTATQTTPGRTVEIPDLAAAVDQFITKEAVKQPIGGTKRITDPYIRRSGQSLNTEPQLDAADQPHDGNFARIPNLGDDGLGAAVTRKFLIDTIVIGANIQWQQCRALRLIDCQIGRNGQSSPWVRLRSVDQTAENYLSIPDLGGSDRTMMVEEVSDITKLSDVSAKTGTGTTVVFSTSPSIASPTITGTLGTASSNWAGVTMNPGPASIWTTLLVNPSMGTSVYIKDATLAKVADIRLASGWTNGTRAIDIPAITAADEFVLAFIEQTIDEKIANRFSLQHDTKAISSGSISVSSDGGFITLQAESGTTDALDTITGGKVGMVIVLEADSGDTIDITDDASSGNDGNIRTLESLTGGGDSLSLTGIGKAAFIGVDIGGGDVEWHELQAYYAS